MANIFYCIFEYKGYAERLIHKKMSDYDRADLIVRMINERNSFAEKNKAMLGTYKSIDYYEMLDMMDYHIDSHFDLIPIEIQQEILDNK